MSTRWLMMGRIRLELVDHCCGRISLSFLFCALAVERSELGP